MSTKPLTYEQVLADAASLKSEEQERLIESLGELVRKRKRFEGSHSPLEFLGLGKEIWRDEKTGELIDAQEYVNRERDSWDG
ncbi:MAG: hypothetical protein H0V86_14875 [Chloroflexia bacterium]|nr:hypothetical protein [Chloroflexia bacterium]